MALFGPVVGKEVLKQTFRYLFVKFGINSCDPLGVKLAYDADGYVVGTVLALSTADNLYHKYDPLGTDGLDVAKCIFWGGGNDVRSTDFDQDASDVFGWSTAVFPGSNTCMYLDLITGLDAGAITDLDAKIFSGSDGVELVTI